MKSAREIIDAANAMMAPHRGKPDTMLMASEYFWAYLRGAYKARVGEHTNSEPITLRNPFTGEIFWMQS